MDSWLIGITTSGTPILRAIRFSFKRQYQLYRNQAVGRRASSSNSRRRNVAIPDLNPSTTNTPHPVVVVHNSVIVVKRMSNLGEEFDCWPGDGEDILKGR